MRAALALCAALGVAAPSAGAAERAIDYAHSEIGFTVRQMGVGVTGTFRKFTVRLQVDPAQLPAGWSAEIEVDIASLATGDPDTDGEAMKPAWLDAGGHPVARFRSRTVRATGAGGYEALGTLTIRGRAREIAVPFTIESAPGGDAVTGLFAIRRTDFGIGGGEWNEDDLVADEIPIRFRIALRPASPGPATRPPKEHP